MQIRRVEGIEICLSSRRDTRSRALETLPGRRYGKDPAIVTRINELVFAPVPERQTPWTSTDP